MQLRKPGLALVLMGTMAPGFAASLSSPSAAPSPELNSVNATPLAIESWSAGSSSLVPLMAADVQAAPEAHVDTPERTTTTATGKPVDDLTFVKRATESGRKEIAAARDALPQLQSPELRRMAEMLVKDHSAANARLSKLAETKGWPLPAPASAAPPPAVTSGGNFDQTWTAEMIAGHERSVALYRAQAQGGVDQELRKYARDTLPTIEHHLSELKSLQK